jgi:hypothetical protein
MGDHLPASCCLHSFTRECPVECLRTVLSSAAFNTLARAESAPFDPPATVGDVITLYRQKRLSQIIGLGPRRIGEIEVSLILAGLTVDDGATA